MVISAVACAGALFAAGTAQAEIVARNAADGLLALNAKGTPSVAYVRGTRVVVVDAGRKGELARRQRRDDDLRRHGQGLQDRRRRPGRAGAELRRSHARPRPQARITPGRPSGLQTSRDDGARLAGTGAGRERGCRPSPIALEQPQPEYPAAARPAGRARKAVEHAERDARRLSAAAASLRSAAPVLGRRAPARRRGVRLRYRDGCLRVVSGRKDVDGTAASTSPAASFRSGPMLAEPAPRDGSTPPGASRWPPSRPAPVTLAERVTNASSEFVLDRALTSALALPASRSGGGGEPVGDVGRARARRRRRGLGRHRGQRRPGRSSLDGWIGGLAVAPKAGRDILLERGGNLEWYRSPREAYDARIGRARSRRRTG